MRHSSLPVLVGRWSVFEQVAHDLMSEVDGELQHARDGLVASEDLVVLIACREQLAELLRVGL